METWRYIEEERVPASFGLAADEYLLGRAAIDRRATLRLYTYRSHAALVGRFQNVEAEVRVDECRLVGAEINRRLTGGGAIVMGESQLGLALTMPAAELPARRNPAALFVHYAEPIVAGLRSLGVEAVFRPKNDIEVNGRKIAGLGVAFDEADSLLFHCSLLVDLDVPLMLRLLTIGPEKISDKDIATFEDRLTTVRRTAGADVSVPDARKAIHDAFAKILGVQFEPQGFRPSEMDAIHRLEEERYLTQDWVFQHMSPPDATGSSVVKTPAGLLRVNVALAGDVMKSVVITGDFFGDLKALRNLEARLKWQRADEANVGSAVKELWNDPVAVPVWELPPEELAAAIMAAVDSAKRSSGAN